MLFKSKYKFILKDNIPFASYDEDMILLHSENFKEFTEEVKRNFERWDVLPFQANVQYKISALNDKL